MNNPRITPKERNLLKGAVRRVFSRSEIRRRVLDTADIIYYTDERPRVKKWSQCQSCNKPTPKYLMTVDHKIPIIHVDETFEDLSLDIVIDRLWCEENNLNPICKDCHKVKTKEENKIRRKNKKERGIKR